MKGNIFIIVIFVLSSVQILFSQTWNTQMVNPGIIDGPKCVMIDNNNIPAIAFRLYDNLIFSKWDGNTWVSNEVYDGYIGNKQYYCLNGIFMNNNYHVFMYLEDDANNRYIRDHFILDINGVRINRITFPGYWKKFQIVGGDQKIFIACLESNDLYLYIFDVQTETYSSEILVDNVAYVGQLDIAIDNNDMIWISYYDGNNKNLKVAKSLNINYDDWDIWFVDTEGDVGSYSQIWLDDTNVAHIAYYDETNEKLKYATFNP